MVTHQEGIEYLVKRLEKKGRHVLTEVTLYDNGTVYSDADVLTIDYKNGKWYECRYEVKSGKGRRSAKHQAKVFFAKHLPLDSVVPRYVYYNCNDEVIRRWKQPYLPPSSTQD